MKSGTFIFWEIFAYKQNVKIPGIRFQKSKHKMRITIVRPVCFHTVGD